MKTHAERQCIAFAGSRRIASGDLSRVALLVKAFVDQESPVLVFDAATSEPVDLDLRGSKEDLLKRLETASEEAEKEEQEQAGRTRGRPKLGVVAREVTLLPRHWDWLAQQPGGASAALRRLVESARRSSGESDRLRQARESTYRFMSAMAGNEPGFEEATRALFAGDRKRFDRLVQSWPTDVREHLKELAASAF